MLEIAPQNPGNLPIVTPPLAADLEGRCDATVAHLRQLNRSAFLQYALGVGEFLVETWYDGDLLLYRDRRSPQHVGFEALLEHRRDALADLGLTGQTLRNYLLGFSAWTELPPPVRDRLELTHLHRLARVEDPIVRGRLAHEAAVQGWPSRQLEEAIDAHKADLRGSKPRRGRPSAPAALKAWSVAFAAVRKARKGKAGVAGLEEKQRGKLRTELQALLAELQVVLGELG